MIGRGTARWYALLASICMGASACVTSASPVAARTDAIAAVRAARELGAADTPESAVHLALADDELERAEALIRSGDMDSAERILVRARADADLAMALRREAAARTQADDSHERVEERREQSIGPDAKEAS
jgi:hypothetical protein